MTALLAVLVSHLATAHAGDVLVSGGLSVMPSVPEVVVPSWRFGAAFGRFTPWGSLVWISVAGRLESEGDELRSWGAMPRIGGRYDFADRVEQAVVPFAGGSVAVLIASADVTNPNDEGQDEPEIDARLPPVAISAGGGLDAPITEALSVSAELGLQFATSRIIVDESVNDFSAIATYGAVWFNIWL